ncbi:phosphopantetheine-binding protein [Paenibacillus amylolyticus]|uniref:phosphopantetheine-binding protein n=1 Tax=Paenibacillus amylolyticus TaxID=1451 RepID=UPI003EB7212B
MDIKKRIRTFIEDNLIRYDEEISFTDDDDIFTMGFVNSLFAMKLLNYIEIEFSITVEGDEMEMSNFSSINNIFGFLKKKLDLPISINSEA